MYPELSVYCSDAMSDFDDNDETPVQDNDEEFFPEAEMNCSKWYVSNNSLWYLNLKKNLSLCLQPNSAVIK